MDSKEQRSALLSENIVRLKNMAVLLVSWRNYHEQALSRSMEHLKNVKVSIARIEEEMRAAEFELAKLQIEESPAAEAGASGEPPNPS